MSFPNQTWTVINHAQCQTSLKLGTTNDWGYPKQIMKEKKEKQARGHENKYLRLHFDWRLPFPVLFVFICINHYQRCTGCGS